MSVEQLTQKQKIFKRKIVKKKIMKDLARVGFKESTANVIYKAMKESVEGSALLTEMLNVYDFQLLMKYVKLSSVVSQ